MKRNNVILDLDNTIICAQNLPGKPYNFNYAEMNNIFRIYERPYLQQFLDFLFKNYNVAVWTAAGKDYAAFIVENFIVIKPERKIDFVMFNNHCHISRQKTGNLKDLTLLWDLYKIPNYNKHNTIILDDNNLVYDPQPNNAILVDAFVYNETKSAYDNELLILLTKINSKFNILNNQHSPICM